MEFDDPNFLSSANDEGNMNGSAVVPDRSLTDWQRLRSEYSELLKTPKALQVRIFQAYAKNDLPLDAIQFRNAVKSG